MAVQISYTDKMGITHSETYAKIILYKISYEDDPIGVIEVRMWHNAAARSKGNASAEKQAVAKIAYVLENTEFTNHLEDSVLKANNVSILSSLYTWLKAHNDSASPYGGDGQRLDNHGNGINWTTATDV